MPTLTIRNIDEATRKRLRLQAAAHGNSVEEEVRQILSGREAAASAPVSTQFSTLIGPSQPPSRALHGCTILLVIAGGIAAYKALDLIRRLRERGAAVTPVLTDSAQEFVTALAAGVLAGGKVYTDLFDRDAEHDVGHIRLARSPDMVVVAPATANILAKMANGLADDLATAILLATDKPVLIAPAMNPAMWSNPATRRNVERLRGDAVHFIGPASGEMAESGESGVGRMAEPLDIVAAVEAILRPAAGLLKGLKILVTSGPTHEPIDPVRYLANRSSGRQGHAIAAAATAAGADVTLVSGPVSLPEMPGMRTIPVETARQMQDAVMQALPVDVAIMAAAVADWRVSAESQSKIKKGSGGAPALKLLENPDILAGLGHHPTLRPKLLIGFAAETDDLIANARKKLKKKGADWILANDVSPETGVMGGDRNTIRLLSAEGVEDWPTLDKSDVARRLVARIAAHFGRG
jgi:phosphopantothenoylcysteine decarboxylase/phosphopantothenate--cysteine ligase